MPAPKYTDEQIEQAAEMRERGLSFGVIARLTGMHEKSIHWHCLRVGADKPRDLRRPAPPRANYVRKDGKVVRRFKPDEDAKLLELAIQGVTISQMCKHLDRKHNTIIGRLRVLARNEARAEEDKAHADQNQT